MRWIQHALVTAKQVEQLLDARADEFANVCKYVEAEPVAARKAVILAAALHDFCKLTGWWQAQVGVPNNAPATELVAHAPNEPQHTAYPITTYAIHDAFFQYVQPPALARALLLALAHQQRPYERIVPRYQLHASWRDAVEAVLKELGMSDFPVDKIFTSQKSTTAMRTVYPGFAAEHFYDFFLLLLRDAHASLQSTAT